MHKSLPFRLLSRRIKQTTPMSQKEAQDLLNPATVLKENNTLNQMTQ